MGGTAQDKEVTNGIPSNYQGQHRCRARLLRHVRQTGPCEKGVAQTSIRRRIDLLPQRRTRKMLHRIYPRGERVGSYPNGWVSLHRLSMGRRLHERARIFQRPVTGVREGCEGAGAEGIVYFCLPKDASANSSPTRNTLRTRVSWLRTRHHAESCSCNCRSVRTRSLRNSKNAPNIPRRMVMDSFSTTRTSVRSPTTGCHAWKRWRKSTAFH